MDNDDQLRLEFIRALDTVSPPAPWLADGILNELRNQRRRSRIQRVREAVRRRPWAVGTGLAVVLLALAVAVAFLAAQLWAPIPVKSPPPLTGSAIAPVETAHFFDANEGVVVTGRGLLITHDGGQHWQLALNTDWKRQNEIRFIDAAHILVLSTSSSGAQTLITTSDGGAHWKSNPIASVAAPPIYGTIFFLNNREGWQVTSSGDPKAPGSLGFYHTTSGGQHWSELWRTGSTPAPDLKLAPAGLTFTDSLHGFMGVFSYDGFARLYITHDGGVTWQTAILSPPPGGWYTGCCTKVITSPAVTMFGDRGVLVEGDVNRSALYSTSDGGQTWSDPRILPVGASSVHFLDLSTGWATGGQNLFETVDGGTNWRQVPVHLPVNGFLSLDGLTSSAQVLWGQSYAAVPGVPEQGCYQAPDGTACDFAIRSVDGGATWMYVKLPAIT